MARTLGSASFAITADFDNAQVKAAADKVNRQVADALKNPNISPNFDSAKLDAQVKATAVKLRTLNDNVKISPELQTAKIDAELAAFKVKTNELMKETGETSAQSANEGLLSNGFMSPAVLGPAIAVGLAILPGAFAVAGAAGAVALGAAFALKGSPVLQAQGKTLITDLETTMTGAASVLDAPISLAFSSIEGQLPVIGGLFKTTFTDVAPLIQPMVTMLTDLVKDVMPGFNTLLQDAQGPLTQFFDTSGAIVGTKLGQFFAALGPGVGSSLSDIEGLLNVFLDLATETAKVSSEIAGIPQLVSKVAGAANTANTPLGQLGKSMKIPDGNKNIFSAFSDGWSWLTSHLPAGNKSLLQLAESQGSVASASQNSAEKLAIETAAVMANRTGLINNIAALQKISGESDTFGNALNIVTGKADAQAQAVQTVTSKWDSYFAVIGGPAQALSAVANDIQNLTGDVKKYGAGSIQAGADVAQLTTDNQNLIDKLEATHASVGQITKAFLATASSQITAADSSKTLQGALVLQYEQITGNTITWGGLKKILEGTSGGLNAASKQVQGLSASQEMNTQQAAKMQQAHDSLTKQLAKAQAQGLLTKNQTDDLTTAIEHNIGQVDTSQKSFEIFAEKLGISKANADHLWSSLKNVAGTYKVSVPISVSGGGTVKIQGDVAVDTGTGIATSLKTGEQTFNGYAYAMGSAKVPGWGNRDSVHAMLTPGEAVVPKRVASSKAFQDLAKRTGIPGYAAGGLIGTSSSFTDKNPNLLVKFHEPKFANSVGDHISNETDTTLAKSLKGSIAAAIAAAKAAAAALSIAGGPMGGVTGGEMANGKELYQYLLRYLFGGNKIAAAGATASIWGESTWDPYAQGTGGRGLIGWTPPGTISNSDFLGGMATQLPAILRFVVNSGDSGVIAEMFRATSVLEAANLWGKGVERYGINDVHSEGLSLASSFMARGGKVFDRGGILDPGPNMVYNLTGKPEHLTNTTNGSSDIRLEFTGGDSEIQQLFVHIMKKYVRITGGRGDGSVQRALGRN